MDPEQSRTPLFDTVLAHAKKRMVSFHTPGHKNGKSIEQRFRNFVGRNIFYMDVTVFGEVDSLHDPTHCIKQAQKLAAKAYDADKAFFLINGSTVGNQAMILTACNTFDEIILPRNTHKSIVGGIILAGATPRYIQPVIDRNNNIVYNVSPEQVEDAIQRYPKAKAVIITNPTYHGISTNLAGIAEVVHKYDKILLVDEAHGPHFKFSPRLPISAIDAGADMCVQSTHKILSGMSQGSLLLIKGKRVDPMRVKRIVSVLQTTSPSYIILGSIDLARMQMATKGEAILDKLIDMCDEGRRQINRIEHIACLRQEDLLPGFQLDPTKITVMLGQSGLSGYDVSRLFNEKYNLQVDYEDLYNIIAISGVGTTKKDIHQLVFALQDICAKYAKQKVIKPLPPLSFATEMVINPMQALEMGMKRVPINKAVGMISAHILSPYPPGIPVLIPGERITREVCDYLQELVKMGIRVSGQEGHTLKTLKVVQES